MKLSISTNFADVAKKINDIGRQAKYAAAVALTKTAKEVREELKAEMGRTFDRPTRYTLNGMYVKGANPTTLEAFVWIKDATFKGTPADRYLKPQIFGGDRALKSMEKALQSAGMMERGQFAVPAMEAKLDSFGNVKRTQIVQIMSQLKVQRGGGYDSRKSNSAASKRTVKRQGVTYFAVAKQLGNLKPGIYVKIPFAHGKEIRPVFIFTASVNYKPRFKFFEVADQTAAKRMPSIFDEELERAIATAFLRNQGSLF